MKVYLAGSIFYEGDKYRNEAWAKKIRDTFPGIDLYSPTENLAINDKTKCATAYQIADGDNERLNQTDILVACIDGDVLPSGTCAEIGKFHEKIEQGAHKYIVGIMTDTRNAYLTHSLEKNLAMTVEMGEQQYCYQNLYVTGLIKQGGILVANIDDAISFLKEKAPEYTQEFID